MLAKHEPVEEITRESAQSDEALQLFLAYELRVCHLLDGSRQQDSFEYEVAMNALIVNLVDVSTVVRGDDLLVVEVCVELEEFLVVIFVALHGVDVVVR